MELEYSDKNSRRSKIYIAVGIIIALLVGATVFVALQASNLVGGEQAVETRTVVVAGQEIAGRATISEADVVLRDVPVDPVNASAFVSLDQVIGRIAGVPIETGQLVTPNLLASTTEGQSYSILEPGQEYDPEMPDLRAVSINVADDRAVAGTLVAGQRVDLIATLAINPVTGQAVNQTTSEEDGAPVEPGPGDPIAGPSTKTTFQSLPILSRNGALYILRADLTTAEKLAELSTAGAQFTLVLRHDADDRTAETDGSTIDQLLEEFDFPMPLIADLEPRAR